MVMKLVDVKQLLSFFNFRENADTERGTVQNVCAWLIVLSI